MGPWQKRSSMLRKITQAPVEKVGKPPGKSESHKVENAKIPTLPSCYLVPPQPSFSSADSFSSTQKLRRTPDCEIRWETMNCKRAPGFLRKPSTNFLKLHLSVKTYSMDFKVEMTQHQDSDGQWRHVDGQDQSALLISSKLSPVSPSLCEGLPSHHGHCRGC